MATGLPFMNATAGHSAACTPSRQGGRTGLLAPRIEKADPFVFIKHLVERPAISKLDTGASLGERVKHRVYLLRFAAARSGVNREIHTCQPSRQLNSASRGAPPMAIPQGWRKVPFADTRRGTMRLLWKRFRPPP